MSLCVAFESYHFDGYCNEEATRTNCTFSHAVVLREGLCSGTKHRSNSRIINLFNIIKAALSISSVTRCYGGDTSLPYIIRFCAAFHHLFDFLTGLFASSVQL